MHTCSVKCYARKVTPNKHHAENTNITLQVAHTRFIYVPIMQITASCTVYIHVVSM